MRDQIHKILKDYWGYTTFRPLQEDIITSVLENKDTLALLPTGGGKSICFQVPVLAREGMGIVISPLIALMTDQVNNLKKNGISALAINSGLSFREIDLGLENCMQGHYKFLYLSPERLQTELVRERLKRMKINLLVVDEAHCISQWGYDFRPPYTRIAEAREWLPDVPILALTATATPKVVDDIQEKLHFRKRHVLQKSFFRPNLYYNVNLTEKKWSKTLEILHRIKGTAIIYVRNRKHTVEVARWLSKNGLSADHYHAGLNTELRRQKQETWLRNQTRIMVCTNAFGMGIDKPDVRLVLHLDLPDSLEAYFQEAGRGGRDGNPSYSVLLVGPSDLSELRKKYLESFPDLSFIKRTYQALANFLQLATGSGEGQTFPFDIADFCKQYSLPIPKAYQALKILEKEGLLILNEGFRQPSRVILKVNRTTLYDFQLRNPKLDSFIKTLSRSYGGLDIEYTPIHEHILAGRLKTTPEKVTQTLLHLKKQGLLDYIKREGDSEISVLQPRKSADYLSISDENLKNRYRDRVSRIRSVEDFIMDSNTCRSVKLLSYFGEPDAKICGHCDVCRRKEAEKNLASDMQSTITALRILIAKQPGLEKELIRSHLKIGDTLLVNALRWLLDAGELEIKEEKYFMT